MYIKVVFALSSILRFMCHWQFWKKYFCQVLFESKKKKKSVAKMWILFQNSISWRNFPVSEINIPLSLLVHINKNSLNVGLLKNKICPTNLISFCDRVGRLVERGSATDKMCLDFRKMFDRVCGDVLLGKMKIHELVTVTLGGHMASWWWYSKGTWEGDFRAPCMGPTFQHLDLRFGWS